MFFDDFWMLGGLESGLDGGFVEVLSDGRHPDTARCRRQRDRGVPRGPNRGVPRGPKAKEGACSRLLQKFVLRDPKAPANPSKLATGSAVLADCWEPWREGTSMVLRG